MHDRQAPSGTPPAFSASTTLVSSPVVDPFCALAHPGRAALAVDYWVRKGGVPDLFVPAHWPPRNAYTGLETRPALLLTDNLLDHFPSTRALFPEPYRGERIRGRDLLGMREAVEAGLADIPIVRERLGADRYLPRRSYLDQLGSYLELPPVRDHILSTLSKVIENVSRGANGYSPYAQRAVAFITDSGDVFFGGERVNGLPPAWGPAEKSAEFVSLSSGNPNHSVVAVIVLDNIPASDEHLGSIGMLGVGTDIVLRHVHWHLGDTLIRFYRSASGSPAKVGDYSFVSDMHHAVNLEQLGEERPLIQRNPQRQKSLVYELPVPFDPRHPDPALIRLVEQEIMLPLVGNSSCLGPEAKRPPGTKAHVAVGFFDNLAVGTVSMRHTRPAAGDCAEPGVAALASMLSDTLPRLHGIAVLSTDWKTIDGRGQTHPKMCDVCVQRVEGMTDPDVGFIAVINLNGSDSPEYYRLGNSDSYLKREMKVHKGSVEYRFR